MIEYGNYFIGMLISLLIYLLIRIAGYKQRNKNLWEYIEKLCKDNYGLREEMKENSIILNRLEKIYEDKTDFLIREYESEIKKLKENNKFLGDQNINLSIKDQLDNGGLKENQKDIIKHSEVFQKDRMKRSYDKFIIILQTSK